MKIAQVAPLYETVPPKRYGGTERVVSYLTEELVEWGHEVTLFASGDSITNAELVACCPRSLRTDPGCLDPLVHHYLMLEEVFNLSSQFDLIHFHVDYLHFPLSRRSDLSQLTTLHGRLDLPDLARSTGSFTTCRWFRSPTRSVADPFSPMAGDGLPWVAGTPLQIPRSARRLPGLHGSHLAGEASGSRHRDREARRAR